MLFGKFRETVFTKNGNDLKRKYEVLEELKKKYPDNEKLNDEYLMVKYGLKGEDEIAYELKDADIGMYVLRDITIQIGDSKAQIDYIIITAAHAYLVECKNLVGDVIVDSKGEFTREYVSGNRKVKKSMYSPVRQAEKHKEILKKIWESNHNKLISSLFEKTFDDYYKILVVMSRSDGSLKLADAPENIRNIVIRSDNLVEHLKNDKVNIEKSDLLSPKQMKEYSDRFLMLTIESKVDYRAEYIEKFELEEVDKEKLRKRLVEFRTRKSKERKIPAYYIFTNQELENLLLYMPKSVDELKENGILTRVKIDLHGEEIVEIVNS